MVFGGKISELLPEYNEILSEYRNMNSRNKWNQMVNDWFYCGLKNLRLKPKAGVDVDKVAGCAYLLSEWFDDVSYEKANPI